MKWSDIADVVGQAAPLLGGVLFGPAGAAGGRLIASALGVAAEPDAVSRALQIDPAAAIKLAEIEATNRLELQRLTLAAETTALAEVNASLRAEAASGDAFVRRMRPTFGYVLAATVALEMGIAAYVALVEPSRLPELAVLFDALVIPQSTALAVLGIYMKKRSDEKTVAAGVVPGPGLLAGLAKRLSG